MKLLTIITFFSALSFLLYGFSCLFSNHMKNEFVRFGLEKRRNLTGVLQILGGLGLIVGYFCFPILISVSSGSLALLMLLGFGVRIKIKDPLLASMPSLLYAILNFYIFFQNTFISELS
ncbi:DoxX family protein [uncultured Aquimarina sp.]|uniref:DoxX family protein n=1 Tax=uncultured Aquimarina sp. TaxID=575652 RepID=UPI00260845BF|nr:DoxX family protein [uncultured Aquimarina sp.]